MMKGKDMNKPDISIVIPCYNSENTIESVVNEIDALFAPLAYRYEIVMVADGCRDNTFGVISRIASKRDNVTAVNLAKNSGQYPALMAGFKYATGDLIATCEDDGQTEVSAYPEMIEKLLKENLDVVTVSYESREQPSLFRRLGTKVAGFMSKAMIPKPDGVGFTITFVARRFVIEEILKYDQPYPFMEGLVFRTTQNVGNVKSIQKGRASGQSGYNLRKLFELWMNGFTSFSIKPLRLSIIVGTVFSCLGFLYGIYLVIKKMIHPGVLVGYTSIVAILLLMSGIILMVLGVVGEYIGRLYMSVNKTPQYVVKEVVKGNDSEK